MLRSVVVVAVASLPVFAGDIPVSPGGSIQAAIDIANNGDRILVAAGAYNESIDFKGKQIEVIGLGGPEATTIDGTGTLLPVVTFHQGEGAASVLRGFTIRGGNYTTGGGHGGGISAYDAATGSFTTPTIQDCIIRDNVALLGGGMAGNATVERCTFYNNTITVWGGGGIWGAPHMIDCLMAGNFAINGVGGGICVSAPGALLEDCVLVQNTATIVAKGGGVFVEPGGGGTMRRCLVARNVCTQGAANLGSGVSTESSNWVVENCTVVDNTVGTVTLTDVGGVEGNATVRNSIVRGNAATEILGASTVTWSNVEGGFPGTGNIDAVPQFVDQVISWDYHLEPGSPCIDKGDPSTFDPDGSVADIGAFPQADLYLDKNTTPNEWLSPGWSTISALVGGKSVYTFHSKADAFSFYGLLGSVTGTTPPTIFLGATVPLVPDWYFNFTLTHPSLPPLHDTIGFLDANGTAHPRIDLPPALINVASPLTAWHAGLLGDPATSTITHVSNAQAIVIVP